MKKINVKIIQAKNKYLNFLKSQEIRSEPFRDKAGQFNNFYMPLANMIYNNYKKKTLCVGLTGSQGSGKSTISYILKIILKERFNLNTVNFSIDDFYKTLHERRKMSNKVSPLFLTRGVPGTHDTKLLYKSLKNLKSLKFKKIKIPKFDKSIDDRVPKKKWLYIKKKPDIVIFEGWCVGVEAQSKKDLSYPLNSLEKKKDKKKIWRTRVNHEIKKNYKKIFNLIDKYVFLKVPSFKYVFKWRLLQEEKLRITSSGKKTMSNTEIKNFIMFYERLTKHMLKKFSKKSDCTITIDNKHRLKSLRFN